MPTNIPLARREVEAAKASINDPVQALAHLDEALRWMTRKPKRGVKQYHTPMNATIRDGIYLVLRQRPELGQQEIGIMFNVDGGRVCETRNGCYGPYKGPYRSMKQYNAQLAAQAKCKHTNCSEYAVTAL